jgi:pimeloyl-ACP methyl ester carboxylesterase
VPYAKNGPTELYYESFGNPADPALLLVNGLGSQCINYREELCQLFVERGFFVTRFDNRDVGLSSKHDEYVPDFSAFAAARRAGEDYPVPYRLPDMAADAVSVLDAIDVERAHVAGMSMGGMIVQQMAIDFPDRVASVTSIMSTTGEHDVGQATPAAFEVLMRATPAASREEYVERVVADSYVLGSPGHQDDERMREHAARVYDRCFAPAGVTRQLMGIRASGDRATALRSLEVDFLVIHGDHDTLIDISGGRRTADCVPGAAFVALEGMGHDLPPAYWDRIVALVGDVAGVGPRARTQSPA